MNVQHKRLSRRKHPLPASGGILARGGVLSKLLGGVLASLTIIANSISFTYANPEKVTVPMPPTPPRSDRPLVRRAASAGDLATLGKRDAGGLDSEIAAKLAKVAGTLSLPQADEVTPLTEGEKERNLATSCLRVFEAVAYFNRASDEVFGKAPSRVSFDTAVDMYGQRLDSLSHLITSPKGTTITLPTRLPAGNFGDSAGAWARAANDITSFVGSERLLCKEGYYEVGAPLSFRGIDSEVGLYKILTFVRNHIPLIRWLATSKNTTLCDPMVLVLANMANIIARYIQIGGKRAGNITFVSAIITPLIRTGFGKDTGVKGFFTPPFDSASFVENELMFAPLLTALLARAHAILSARGDVYAPYLDLLKEITWRLCLMNTQKANLRRFDRERWTSVQGEEFCRKVTKLQNLAFLCSYYMALSSYKGGEANKRVIDPCEIAGGIHLLVSSGG